MDIHEPAGPPAAAAPPTAADPRLRAAAGIRASDAEREQTATRLREAAAEGRLDLAELEERLASAYAAQRRHELAPLVADLPVPVDSAPEAGRRPAGRGPARRLDTWDRTALGLHAILVVMVTTAAIGRWVALGEPFPWPVFPIFWALVTLAVHARLRIYGRPGRAR